MKKCILLLTVLIALSLAGCDAADNGVTHRDGNLIVTNYSDYEITDITVSHLGKTVSVSPAPIKNTQICYFTLAPASDYVYKISFMDREGEEHWREFTDTFSEDTQILIAIQYSDNGWTIDYDK